MDFISLKEIPANIALLPLNAKGGLLVQALPWPHIQALSLEWQIHHDDPL